MSYLAWLLPIALGMGVAGLAAFFWSLRDGQYDDMQGAPERILLAQEEDRPLTYPPQRGRPGQSPARDSGGGVQDRD